MNIPWAILLLTAGLAVLWKSADVLVSGAVALAKQLGISSLVVGLTIVAMGTSAPEVAASIAAALRGAGDIAIGNIYGSNIANLALVGGLSAIILPISVKNRILTREMPVMVLVALLLWPFLRDLHLGRLEGATLLVLFVILIAMTVLMAKREMSSKKLATENTEKMDSHSHWNDKNIKSILLVVIGMVGLALGAEMTVRSAVVLGQKAGLSKAVIGLTIIAIGTSLPELATCVVAALRKHHDISIGNLVGSNIFNTLLVTGTAGVIRPFSLAKRLMGADYWIMVGVTAGFVLLAILGRRIITRLAGTILLCGYVTFLVYLLA